MVTTHDLARLRSLAEAATPGPWETERGGIWHERANGIDAIAAGCTLFDAAYIAAVDPQTVLALLDAAALGLAWNRAEAALPDGYGVSVHGPDLWGKWIASAGPNIFDREATDFTSGDSTYRGQHDSQLAALDALAEKLEARK